jgi:hypothetical protein
MSDDLTRTIAEVVRDGTQVLFTQMGTSDVVRVTLVRGLAVADRAFDAASMGQRVGGADAALAALVEEMRQLLKEDVS